MIGLAEFCDDSFSHLLHKLVGSFHFVELSPGYPESPHSYFWMKLYHLYLRTYYQGVKQVPLKDVASKISMPWTGSL